MVQREGVGLGGLGADRHRQLRTHAKARAEPLGDVALRAVREGDRLGGREQRGRHCAIAGVVATPRPCARPLVYSARARSVGVLQLVASPSQG